MDISEIAIIAGDAEVTEQICARLRKHRIYLPVIEAPLVRLEKYGFFDGDCIRVANAIKLLKPKQLIFVKISSQVSEKLRGYLRHFEPICFELFDENLLGKHVQFNRTRIAYADLQMAGVQCSLFDLFVVEGEFSVAHIIAANLAVAHGGRVIPIESATDNDVSNLKEQSRIWSNGSAEETVHAKNAILEFTRARLPNYLFNQPAARSISFVSNGIPYGVLPFRCPTTHYFSFPLLGLSVLLGILKSRDEVRCPIAILIDPNTVGKSEFTTLQRIFGTAGYLLRQVYDENATVKNATYLCGYMPSDFIFFSTHCGELDGQRITERFSDRHGKLHVFCYDQALSISHAPGTELFEVIYLYFPISMDGVDWKDLKAKEEINAGESLEDFMQLAKTREKSEKQPEILDNKKTSKISGFEALRMSDGNYFPFPQMVGGFYYPVVFNNSCSSWRTLAMNFGCNGASAYIGTSTDISNFVAVPVASLFVQEVTSGKAIGPALFRSQRQFTEQFGYTPYLMHGYLFTKLTNPKPQNRSNIIPAIKTSIAAVKRLNKTGKEISAVHFLEIELTSLLKKLSLG